MESSFSSGCSKVEGSNKKCEISVEGRHGERYRGFNTGVCILDIKLLDLILYFFTATVEHYLLREGLRSEMVCFNHRVFFGKAPGLSLGDTRGRRSSPVGICKLLS